MTTKQDAWSETADLYALQAAQLTEHHGADMVALLHPQLVRAKTVLEVGCGTGAFCKAYMRLFPQGIEGQTLILSDLSPSMMSKAKESIQPPTDFLTKIVFQEEDGTKLQGIQDDSIDIVVSLFGIFLIPDRRSTLQMVRRVLKSGGTIVNASWAFDTSRAFAEVGIGVSLQDAFHLVLETINPDCNQTPEQGQFTAWSNIIEIKQILETYEFSEIRVLRGSHTTIWEWEPLWQIISQNPLSNVRGAPPKDIQRAKEVLQAFLKDNYGTLDQPMPFSTVSNIAIGTMKG